MHCAQARNLIALLIGNDLDETERPEIERHMSQCKSCSSYYESLSQAHQQLQSIGPEDSGIHSVNLWKDLEPSVRLANSGRSTKRFNGWVAGLAIAATVMAMFAISNDFGPVNYDDGSNSGFSPGASSVSWPAQSNPELAPQAADQANDHLQDQERSLELR